jgi:Cof subfamily protein (haloacid dehalogenase superfamily)
LYKAVFIDVDGTLIRSDHSISKANIETIQRLKEKDLLLVLVSARPLSGMLPVAEAIGLHNDPLASLNGAYISSGRDIIFDEAINCFITKRLHEKLEKYNASIIYYWQDLWFSHMQSSDTDYEQKITSVPIIIQPFDLTFKSWKNNFTGPNKILIIAAEKEIMEMQDLLGKQFMQHLNIYTSKPTYLEIMSKKASKLNALKLFMDRYNIKRKETIAIGDNFNDKEMIEFAGIGIAMGNAPFEVKAAADLITETNDYDGVSNVLKEIFDI